MMMSQIPPRLDRLIKENGRATQVTGIAFSSSLIATRLQLEADMESALLSAARRKPDRKGHGRNLSRTGQDLNP
jgi:hypothetical protein